ncbi:enoyl-CoA hydratase [Rhodomicrobium sp. Az07]|uniref:enoyl-CoA hydratase n=1 Tax=Rhodomicrobium sp. Az07 TaxID=2839034 RepID=UPI001BE4EECC|nr:enoyl-CoA hydratase [Rhodomicrobium sp. Az07]MBT3070752.1 enoyl-CoA hydratase [Rhodomicrobium sp. Az07]
MTTTTQTPDTPEPLLLTERRGKISILTMNRARARNSLSLGLIAALHDAIAADGGNREVAAIVLAGAPPAFSAGHDLKELTAHRTDADRGRAFFDQTMRACAALMQAVVACPKPVIAAVGGIATAAGCQLVASCDLTVAGDRAQFATPGVNIGLFCSTPMVALSRNVSRKAAMEMLLLGDMVDATRARELGLVNWVVPDAEVLPAALEVAGRIAAKSPLTVAIGKKAFYAQGEMPLAAAYDYTAQVMVENMLARDAEEGIGAFIEKRTPEWMGT